MGKVLIVDDAAFIRLTIRTILEKNGFEVVGEAETGEQGIKKYMETKPDIVTMDITMPVMTGIEALKKIREYDQKAKIIMLSAMGQESMVKEAITCGAINFIVKPFKEDHLVSTLTKVMAMRN